MTTREKSPRRILRENLNELFGDLLDCSTNHAEGVLNQRLPGTGYKVVKDGEWLLFYNSAGVQIAHYGVSSSSKTGKPALKVKHRFLLPPRVRGKSKS